MDPVDLMAVVFGMGDVGGAGAPAGAGAGAVPTEPHVHIGAHTFPIPLFGGAANARGGPGQPQRQPRPKKAWTLPPSPGLTLRQRVERLEREAGLRCADVSCGIGPTDEDPAPTAPSPAALKQIAIRPLYKEGDGSGNGKAAATAATGTVCEHRFHPACLVTAERVAGWANGAEKDLGDEVEVACPRCRAIGCVSREDWEEGVRESA